MIQNTIKKIEIQKLYSDFGIIHEIFIDLDIYDRDGLDGFISQVIQKFTTLKFLSPPDTSRLLIRISGAVTATEFISKWNLFTYKDKMMKSIMSLFKKADIIFRINEHVIEEKSLLTMNVICQDFKANNLTLNQ